MRDGCVVVPGSDADRMIQRAWDEDRIVPVNAAARKNYKKIKGREYDGPSIESLLKDMTARLEGEIGG